MKNFIEKINKHLFNSREIEAVEKIIREGMLSRPEGGAAVKQFQKDMADKHNKKYAYSSVSGTAALHLAISSLQLQKGDEVIVPALSNIADCSVVIQEGLVPVFADACIDDMNIDPADIKRKITSKTKAIIVVHMYGQPARLEEIMKIANENNLVIIEDCAQAAGAEYKGQPVGSFGDISCFSLYQTKHIVCGEGGMVLTNNQKYYEIIRSLANNGIKRDNLDDYDYDLVGYNYQLTEIQAVIAIEQLKKLDDANNMRIKNVESYKRYLKDIDLNFQKVNDNTKNVYFYLAVLLPKNLASKREEFMSIVQKSGTPIKKLYPLSLPEVELIKKQEIQHSCPIAREIAERVVNFYVNPGLIDDDINFFSNSIIEAYNKINE